MRPLIRAAIRTMGIVALLSLPKPSAETGGARRPTLQLEFHEGTDMEAVPSPDGRHLALQLWSQIWILDPSTGEARRLTDAFDPPDEHWYPRWSPDGSSIAYSSRRSDGGLFVVPALGGSPRQLTFQECDNWASWSPDGQTIVFSRDPGGLWIVPARGGDAQRLDTEANDARQPSCSPDGRWIACVWQGRVTVMAADGSSVRQITKGPEDQAPSWSPDSRQLFFLSGVDGALQVWSVPVEGGEPTQLTREQELLAYAPGWLPRREVLTYTAGGRICTLDPRSGTHGTIPFSARLALTREPYVRKAPQLPAPGQRLLVRGICSPAPSPDGRLIAFAALGDLWVRRADGKAERLTSGPEDDVDPAWSPDGRLLAFASNRSGDYQVWTLDLASRARRQVTNGPGHVAAPLWHPSGESIVFVYGSSSWAQLTIGMAPAAGGAVRTIVPAGAADVRPLGWFADDHSLIFLQLVYGSTTGAAQSTVRRVRIDGSPVSWTADPPVQVEFAAVSPQGDRLAYVSNGELWVRPLAPEGLTDRRLAEGPALFPAWSPDHALVYVNAGKLVRVDARTGAASLLPLELSCQVPGVTQSLLLRNARLLTPEPREGLWDVWLRDGRIQSLRPAGTEAARADRTMDLEGGTVIPGLLAVHEHMFRGFPAEAWLYWGVTSLAAAGDEGPWAVAQQEAISSGRRQGPRIFPSGGFVAPTQMNAFPQVLRVKTPEQLSRYVDHLSGLGATQVKAYGRSEPWVEAECVRAAHRRGLPVLSHFLRPASVAAGLDRKEHLNYFGADDEIRTRFAQDTIEILRKAGITVSSTLVAPFIVSSQGRPRFKAALTRADVAGFLLPSQAEFLRTMDLPSAEVWDRYLKLSMANAAIARAAGIRIVAGTDYPQLAPGLHWELELLVKAGFSPLEALRTATSTAAAVLGVEDQLGCISPGAIADLVVLKADPLEDIRNTQEISAVIQGGRIVDRDALLAGSTRR